MQTVRRLEAGHNHLCGCGGRCRTSSVNVHQRASRCLEGRIEPAHGSKSIGLVCSAGAGSFSLVMSRHRICWLPLSRIALPALCSSVAVWDTGHCLRRHFALDAGEGDAAACRASLYNVVRRRHERLLYTGSFFPDILLMPPLSRGPDCNPAPVRLACPRLRLWCPRSTLCLAQ